MTELSVVSAQTYRRESWQTSIKVGVGYAELRCRHCSEVVNDQMELRIIDTGDLYCGSQNKTEYDRMIERLKRGV